MGSVTYEIHHTDKKREKQVYHINLLKQWKEALIQVPLAPLLVAEVNSKWEENTLAYFNQSA